MARTSGSATSAARHRRGVAAIEFVLVVPVLLLLYYGTINLNQYIAVNRKINLAAELVADLVTRHANTITAADIDDYFIAAGLSIRPLGGAGVGISVYDFYWDAGTVKTKWSRSSNAQNKCTVPASTSAPISSLVNANTDPTLNADVIVAVICMPFVPPSNFPGLPAMFRGLNVEKQVILKPRQSQTLVCTGCT
jgi:Flp pilus assembly protein TadG